MLGRGVGRVSGGGNSQSRPHRIPSESAPGRQGHNGRISAHEAEDRALIQIRSQGVGDMEVRARWPAPSGQSPEAGLGVGGG